MLKNGCDECDIFVMRAERLKTGFRMSLRAKTDILCCAVFFYVSTLIYYNQRAHEMKFVSFSSHVMSKNIAENLLEFKNLKAKNLHEILINHHQSCRVMATRFVSF